MRLRGVCLSLAPRVSVVIFFHELRVIMIVSPVTEMLLAILSICSQEELDEPGSEDEAGMEGVDEAAIAARKHQIKRKILAVGRMRRVFQLLRYITFHFTSQAIF